MIDQDLSYLEVSNLQVESHQNIQELNYYSSVIKNANQEQEYEVFIIVPVKQKVPNVRSRISFDFEINILDFRHSIIFYFLYPDICTD